MFFMKWAKTQKEIEEIRKRLYALAGKNPKLKAAMDAEISKFYFPMDKITLQTLKEAEFKPWLTYTQPLPKHYEKARSRYEAFVGGYVYYFEHYHSNHKDDERIVYFDWGRLNKSAKLTIYMHPLHEPVKKNPVGKDTIQASNGKNGTSAKKKTLSTMIPVPPDDDSLNDPPPPPPPPPPPRD
jgi:hypothetical protein